MTDPQIRDQIQATTELTDAVNRLTAQSARLYLAMCWLAAVIEWAKKPWWSRGKAPKMPKGLS